MESEQIHNNSMGLFDWYNKIIDRREEMIIDAVFLHSPYKWWWQVYKKENDGTIRENDSRHDFDLK